MSHHTNPIGLIQSRTLHTTILARSLASGTSYAKRSEAYPTGVNGAIPFIRAVKGVVNDCEVTA